MNRLIFCIVIVILGSVDLSSHRLVRVANAFHDCVQSRKRAKDKRLARQNLFDTTTQDEDDSCAGGICVGMTNGPHQGGNASYPLAWNGTAGTKLESYLTVPKYPRGLHTRSDFSKITYYIWTDIFFGDESLGRMNQLVPQLILGRALDGSSDSPDFAPEWREVHTKWTFGAHYFFEVWNPSTNTTDAHAAYGEMFATGPGETLKTTFELSIPPNASSPAWTLTMSVVGDSSRTSILTIPEPYMGLGNHWKEPSKSWLEPNFHNLCINACWELYGASNLDRLPGSGATYHWSIEQPMSSNAPYEFTTWERDEGNGECPSCEVSESHTERIQDVLVEIDIATDSTAAVS